MTKSYGRFVTALFCLFLGGMLVWSLLLPDRDRSEVENRTLAQWPKLSLSTVLDGSFMSGVEKYVADQFPMRDDWTGLKARVEKLIGKSLFNGVYLAEDETLISKVDEPDQGQVDRNLYYVNRLNELTGGNVILGLIPSAAEIWKDKLPAGAESWDQAAFIQSVQQSGTVTMADFLSVLGSHQDEEIFYRTDHHWTTLGAYYGYTALMQALGREDDILPPEAFTQETVSTDFNGTLYSSSGIHWLTPDEIQFWASDENLTVTSWRTGSPVESSLYDRGYLEKKDKYSAFLGGNQPMCVIRNSSPDAEGSILLVRDSYSDALAPFLAQNFAEVHLLDLRYYHASVAQYAAEQGIDTVAVLYGVSSFVTDRNLSALAQ